MKKNFFYFLSIILNLILLFYIWTKNVERIPSNLNLIDQRIRSKDILLDKNPYCRKFDQRNRLTFDDLSIHLDSIENYHDDIYDWDICRSKKLEIRKSLRSNDNQSLNEMFVESIEYCSFTPRIEQMYQLGFYGGQQKIKWPKFFSCALLPPPSYRWPNKHIEYPTPVGQSAIFWSNLGLKSYNDVLTFNQRYPQNVIHFDSSYYDLYHESSANLGSKYIPFGQKIRTMLDIGSGAGSLGFALTKRYDILVLNTVRPEFPYCEFISERGGLCLLLDSDRPMPFAKFSFDVVHHAWVYHGNRPSEWRTILLEQNRLIRPGGYLWIRDGMSRAVLQTIRFLLIEQLGYRILYQDEKIRPLPIKVFFGSIPYEVEWTAILIKPNRIKGNEFFC